MADDRCSCKQFETLEGASVPAYISAYLDSLNDSTLIQPHYGCRVCGQEWGRRSPDQERESKRASLVRLRGTQKK